MEPHIEPGMLRSRVIDALGHLSPEEHLDVLHAMDNGDTEIEFVDPATLLVTIRSDLRIEIPLRDCTVVDDA